MRWLAGVVMLLVSVHAAAQQTTLEPSAAAQCLTAVAGARNAPEYPIEAFLAKRAGRVKVQLTFVSPGKGPDVQVLDREGADSAAFVASVDNHVRNLRVPCHDAGNKPVRLVFDFAFSPGLSEVTWSKPLDADLSDDQACMDCMLHLSGLRGPDFPAQALRAGVYGRFLVRMRFDAADKGPAIEIFSGIDPAEVDLPKRRAFRQLESALRAWALDYRVPCLDARRPVTVILGFDFIIEGSYYGFKPGLTVRDLLPLVRDIRKQRIEFDFTAMGCPFDLKLQYRRPFMLNLVGESAGADPARRPFIEWLQQVELDLPPATRASVFADTALLTVPCLKINLSPQE